MNGRIIQPLFSFDSLFNEEIGLINFIQTFCADSDMWYAKIKEDINSEFGIPHILNTRVEENPLSPFVKDEYKDDIDSLYEDFMNPDNKDGLYVKAILSHSPIIFSIANIFIMSMGMGSINPTVMVRNKYELDKLNRSFKDKKNKFSVVICGSKNEMIKEFLTHDSFILHNISDILNMYDLSSNGDENFLVGNTIYVSDSGYNRILLEETDLGKTLSFFNNVNYYSTKKMVDVKDENDKQGE